jgi:hypothetical protein
MSKSFAIAKGQHYRETRSRLWGNLAQVWVVEDVFVGTDGVEYARLACVNEPSMRKTLSLAVLKDKSRFGVADSAAARPLEA